MDVGRTGIGLVMTRLSSFLLGLGILGMFTSLGFLIATSNPFWLVVMIISWIVGLASGLRFNKTQAENRPNNCRGST